MLSFNGPFRGQMIVAPGRRPGVSMFIELGGLDSVQRSPNVGCFRNILLNERSNVRVRYISKIRVCNFYFIICFEILHYKRHGFLDTNSHHHPAGLDVNSENVRIKKNVITHHFTEKIYSKLRFASQKYFIGTSNIPKHSPSSLPRCLW